MDVFLVIVVCRRAIRLLPAVALDAGCTYDPPFRHREPHVVGAEIGEELRRGVELVAVPAGVIVEDADFRKPLGDEVEVADRAGAREGARHT